jgi:hypothetical protein
MTNTAASLQGYCCQKRWMFNQVEFYTKEGNAIQKKKKKNNVPINHWKIKNCVQNRYEKELEKTPSEPYEAMFKILYGSEYESITRKQEETRRQGQPPRRKCITINDLIIK